MCESRYSLVSCTVSYYPHGILYGWTHQSKEQEETWGVFNSVQGFGSMIGPLLGGLITQFTNNLNILSIFLHLFS